MTAQLPQIHFPFLPFQSVGWGRMVLTQHQSPHQQPQVNGRAVTIPFTFHSSFGEGDKGSSLTNSNSNPLSSFPFPSFGDRA